MTDFIPVDRAPSLTSQVSEALLAAIAAGKLRPGERLPSERDLSEQFGVSRTVIRETVRSLEAKGVIRQADGRGSVIVAVPSSRVAEALDLYMRGAQSQDLLGPEHIDEVRTTLETRLAFLAAERATGDDVRDISDELRLMAEAKSPSVAARHDAEFHRKIAQATHNALFVTLIESLNTALRTIRSSSLGSETRLPIAVAEHQAILDAIAQHDGTAAATAMGDHLDRSRSYYLGAGCH